MQKRDLRSYWSKLTRAIARKGGISYTELKALDVFEFFIMLANYEEEVNREIKQAKNSLNKNKK